MKYHARSLCVVAGLMTGACSPLAPQADDSRFFVLTPMPADSLEASSSPNVMTLGVGPVRLPGYLERTNLVTRRGATRVDLSDTDRWAEPLSTQVARVLAENLTILLRPDRVIALPSDDSTRSDYWLELRLQAFERDGAGNAFLRARWSIRDAASGRRLLERESRFQAASSGQTTEDHVTALSHTVADLSKEIAEAIRRLDR